MSVFNNLWSLLSNCIQNKQTVYVSYKSVKESLSEVVESVNIAYKNNPSQNFSTHSLQNLINNAVIDYQV